MKPLVLASVAAALVGGAAGFSIWKANDSSAYDWFNCKSGDAYDPPDASPFLYRVRVESQAEDHIVRVCIRDEEGRTVFNQQVAVLFGNVRTIDAWITADTINPSIESKGHGGGYGPVPASMCSSQAFQESVRFTPGFQSGFSGCIARPTPPASAVGQADPGPFVGDHTAVLSGPWLGAAIGAGFAVVGLVGLYRFRRWIRVGVLFLFSRVTGPKSLEQPIRNQIHALVSTEPGLNGTQIRRRLQLATGQSMYHLAVLEREGIVTSVGLTPPRYFLVGKYGPDEMRRRAALRNERLGRFYEAVAQNPGANVQGLAHQLGLSRPRASRLARRLEAAGLVTRERDGRDVRLHAVDT